MSLYTGKGDNGETSLLCKGRVSKVNDISDAIAMVDALQADLMFIPSVQKDIAPQLFKFNSFMATKAEDPRYQPTEADIKTLEDMIEVHRPSTVLPKFVMWAEPYDAEFCWLNRCRVSSRAAERAILASPQLAADGYLKAWFNRLSSVFFTMMLEVAERKNLRLVYRGEN